MKAIKVAQYESDASSDEEIIEKNCTKTQVKESDNGSDWIYM
jgi:hypothetical protein